jgi:hypothetical protein
VEKALRYGVRLPDKSLRGMAVRSNEVRARRELAASDGVVRHERRERAGAVRRKRRKFPKSGPCRREREVGPPGTNGRQKRLIWQPGLSSPHVVVGAARRESAVTSNHRVQDERRTLVTGREVSPILGTGPGRAKPTAVQSGNRSCHPIG